MIIIDTNDIERFKKEAEKLGVNWFALLQAVKNADADFLNKKNVEIPRDLAETEMLLNSYPKRRERFDDSECEYFGDNFQKYEQWLRNHLEYLKKIMSDWDSYHYELQREALKEFANKKNCFDSYGDDFVSEVKKNVRYKVNILEAKEQMQEFLKSSYGDSYVWRDSYDRVAEWLSDSNNRGLFMFGNCGTGKTVMCKIILRLVRMQCSDYDSQYCKMYDSVSNLSSEEKVNQIIGDIKGNIEGKRNVLTIIDDFGKESLLNNYGNKRETFSDIVDVADRFGTLLVASTNLDVDTLKARYGDRTIDRLKGMCRFVYFSGDSFRKLEGESL